MKNCEHSTIQFEYSEPLIAGEHITLTCEYTVGENGFAQNGKLRIGLPNTGWFKPLVPQYYFWSEYADGKNRTYTQYHRVNTSARLITSSKAATLLDSERRFRKPWTFPRNWLRDYVRYWITVTIEDDHLQPGDKIIVTYGDPEYQPLTARIQGYPEKRICFLAFADAHGNGQFTEVTGSPLETSVHSGPAHSLVAITPSIIKPQQQLKVKIAYSDKVKAAPEPLPAVKTLRIGTTNIYTQYREVSINNQTDSLYFELPEFTPPPNGTEPLYIHVHDPDHEMQTRSNPSLARSRGHQLFWGDLHGQSQYHSWSPQEQVGISCNTPKECYRYARDIAGLDFCSITDTRSIIMDIWKEEVETSQRMNEPGRFVTFQGSEVGDNINGHRNVIFAGDQPEPMITAPTGQENTDLRELLQTPRLHQRFAERNDVLLIPHHVKIWLDWNCHNPHLEPVMEIYSVWGCGEKHGSDLWDMREVNGGAQEAWARGYKIGVIGGSDTHAGLPGRSIPNCDRESRLHFPGGLTAVWASELTRGSLFEALRARRCYATTGVRIILETFINQNPMGSEIHWPDFSKARQLRINVWGTDELEEVTIVKNNDDVYTFDPKSEQAQLEWEDRTQARIGDYYYVRVIQQDGNRAWSSPIWLGA